MRRALVLVTVGLAITGCAAVQQQKAQPGATDNLQFKNLKVLPPNVTHDELIALMKSYAQSLGTRCEHCHVEIAKEPRQEMDFASDARPEKTVARAMMRMTAEANNRIEEVNEHGQKVTCATCHRGKTVPEPWTPPAPRPRAQPDQPQPDANR